MLNSSSPGSILSLALIASAAVWLAAPSDASADSSRRVSHQAALDYFDENRNGYLDAEERLLLSFDQNGDGYLSRSERRRYRAYQKQNRLDRDRDGYIEAWERRDHRARKKARRWIAKLDYNRDGLIHRREARGHALGRNFFRADLNRDRYVSRYELIAYFGGQQTRPTPRPTVVYEPAQSSGCGSHYY